MGKEQVSWCWRSKAENGQGRGVEVGGNSAMERTGALEPREVESRRKVQESVQ